jgi:hypothetical protein
VFLTDFSSRAGHQHRHLLSRLQDNENTDAVRHNEDVLSCKADKLKQHEFYSSFCALMKLAILQCLKSLVMIEVPMEEECAYFG